MFKFGRSDDKSSDRPRIYHTPGIATDYQRVPCILSAYYVAFSAS